MKISKQLTINFIIGINIMSILAAINNFIGLKLAYKYGTLPYILNDYESEDIREELFNLYIDSLKDKEGYTIIILLLLFFILFSLFRMKKMIKHFEIP